ncbi:hypothetical protein CHLRE_14g624850v5 [Chlamydomonas reinhardtii]|uniref:Uncharacterized protein n=1 Tax=Chlamydomonas reinhardtii TaxID=3055 RepID=A0A2K3CY83_CHLRE|nr:uncharacterized protein CHLRE_14g624850v5 [Chlamydomonas reinhardtii]PNW73248.1 hypothetical protein CHLRE_14g624850v5 [Chlamydomonas reinhardtii]
MRPCPAVHRRVPPGPVAGHKQLLPLQRSCRGAPLVCRTAAPMAPSWAETRSAAASAPILEPDMLPSTSAPFISPMTPYVPEEEPTRTPPSIKDTGTLRPASEWYPQWMQYRRREDNYVFWQDKFMRCSTDIPWAEKRWTLFSTVWYLVQQLRFVGTPPALRYVAFLGWRALMFQVYAAHKALVLWQCKLDAGLARIGSGGATATFSKTMALRRLHWRNSPLAEALYALNLYKTGRVHLLPPVAKPIPRPTFFWLF